MDTRVHVSTHALTHTHTHTHTHSHTHTQRMHMSMYTPMYACTGASISVHALCVHAPMHLTHHPYACMRGAGVSDSPPSCMHAWCTHAHTNVPVLPHAYDPSPHMYERTCQAWPPARLHLPFTCAWPTGRFFLVVILELSLSCYGLLDHTHATACWML